jgi:hypothetical protein
VENLQYAKKYAGKMCKNNRLQRRKPQNTGICPRFVWKKMLEMWITLYKKCCGKLFWWCKTFPEKPQKRLCNSPNLRLER